MSSSVERLWRYVDHRLHVAVTRRDADGGPNAPPITARILPRSRRQRQEEDADAAASALALLMWMATQEAKAARRLGCLRVDRRSRHRRASTTHINALAATMMLGAIEFASVGSTATAAAAQGVIGWNARKPRHLVDTAVSTGGQWQAVTGRLPSPSPGELPTR